MGVFILCVCVLYVFANPHKHKHTPRSTEKHISLTHYNTSPYRYQYNISLLTSTSILTVNNNHFYFYFCTVCIHEEDNGVIWKHVNWRNGETQVRRGRKLVVSFFTTIANYEYGFYYYFGQVRTCDTDSTSLSL